MLALILTSRAYLGRNEPIWTMLGALKLTSASSASGRRAISVISRAAVARQTSAPTTSLSPLGHDKLTPSRSQQVSVRRFGRKASKMGHHIEKAEELAHRAERQDARNKRHKKKGGGKGGAAEEESADTPGRSMEVVDLHIEEDATETIFEHGSADDEDLIDLPDKDDVKSRMTRVVDAMVDSFRAIRGAEPTPELFEPIMVRAYGELTPLSAVAQVVISSPNQATLTCYDPETAKAVSEAVRDSGLNFNPRIEEGGGGVVVVPIPKVSMETRKALAKQLGKAAEASRQRVRRIRRAAHDVCKKGQAGKLEGISKDDAFRRGKEIDAVTEEIVALLNQKVEEKQNSVMAV